MQRGIYSNEAGQGTAPHAAAAAEVSHPYKQGLVQGFSVYVDTLFVCTATALIILFTNQYNVMDSGSGYIVENLLGVEAGAAFTQNAVSVHFPAFGNEFVAVALMFFALPRLWLIIILRSPISTFFLKARVQVRNMDPAYPYSFLSLSGLC